MKILPLLLILLLLLTSCNFLTKPPVHEPKPYTHPSMTFFVTSRGMGDVANLGGIDGADRHCRELAEAVGQGGKRWRAYLSASGVDMVNAKDRIGDGPWYNARGAQIAYSNDHLHDKNNNLSKETALNEFGLPINGVGDNPNQHQILTGSDISGTVHSGDGF